METLSITVCSTCHEPLNAKGECLACLLRGGLDGSVEERAPHDSLVFGNFEIARREDGSLWELGSGAMGVTYRAVDKVLHRTVALKVIEIPEAAGVSQAVRERFLREARAAAALKHPNVAGIFQFGALPEINRCYYAMELVEGETLEALVRRDGPLKPERALEIAIQVTRALVAAAVQGLIHRDLKPGNIMLARATTGTAEMEVKVIDFGLAKATNGVAEADLTHGGFVGTPSFASPEQFDGAPADARSDIYSLGVTLWYALTGQVPYPGRTIEEIRDRQQHADLPIEHLSERGIATSLIEMLRQTLAVNPTQRPASAREMLEALESCRAKLASPKQTPFLERVRKVAPLTAILAIALTLVLLFLRQKAHVAASDAALLPEKSIAVLPFENLSKDEANTFFAGGVQDEILSDLAKIADLKVISRTSVMKYKSTSERNLREIGRALGVAHIVEGSVQRVANHVRVNAQLIDARTDAHLWAETYDGDLADVFGIQSEIAQRIAEQLRAKISPSEKAVIMERPTADLTAYALYNEAKGLGSWNDWRDLDQSRARRLELLREAVRRDPNFVLAYCLLAKLYGSAHAQANDANRDSGPVDELWKQAIDSAMRLRPDLGEPYLARARYYLFTNNFEAARDALAMARGLLPNDSETLFMTARVDRHQNRWEESLANVRAANELDPHNGEIIMWECEMYRLMRRYFEGEQFVRQAMASIQELTSSLHVELAKLKLAEGNPRGAQEILTRVPQDKGPETRFQTALYLRDYDAAARVIAATPADQAEGAFDGKPPRSLCDAELARDRGDNKAAQAAFLGARQDWEQDPARGRSNEWYFTNIALLDAGLGRKEEAIREAQHVVELVPIARDALYGTNMMINLACVYAWTGERDLAIEKLEMLSKIPNDVSYGDLRFNPRWDPLRKDPRFEKIIASLEPKKIDK